MTSPGAKRLSIKSKVAFAAQSKIQIVVFESGCLVPAVDTKLTGLTEQFGAAAFPGRSHRGKAPTRLSIQESGHPHLLRTYVRKPEPHPRAFEEASLVIREILAARDRPTLDKQSIFPGCASCPR